MSQRTKEKKPATEGEERAQMYDSIFDAIDHNDNLDQTKEVIVNLEPARVQIKYVDGKTEIMLISGRGTVVFNKKLTTNQVVESVRWLTNQSLLSDFEKIKNYFD